MAQSDQDGVWEVLLRCAKYENSKELFKKALHVAESNHGPDSLQVGSVCGEFAQYLRAKGDIETAERYESRAEQILRNFVLKKPDLMDSFKKRSNEDI